MCKYIRPGRGVRQSCMLTCTTQWNQSITFYFGQSLKFNFVIEKSSKKKLELCMNHCVFIGKGVPIITQVCVHVHVYILNVNVNW